MSDDQIVDPSAAPALAASPSVITTSPSGNRDAVDVSISAGLGAGFGQLSYMSLSYFLGLTTKEKIEDVVAIVLVAVAVVKFIEPLAERFLATLNVAEKRHHTPGDKPRWFRIATFSVVVFTSISHGLLHSLIGKDSIMALSVVVVGTALAGGITYWWTKGAARTHPHVARYGLFAGLALPVGIFITMSTIFGSERIVQEFGLPDTPISMLIVIFFSCAFWAPSAFLGGLFVDRGWLQRPTRGAVVGLLIPSLILAVVTIIGLHSPLDAVLTDVAKTVGWGLGLLIHPKADEVLGRAGPMLNT